jgi:hypothetical protein
MNDTIIAAITLVVLIGVSGTLILALFRSFRRDRGPIRRHGLWSTFGLSLAFCLLFVVTWAAQAVAEWGVYRSELPRNQSPSVVGYLTAFGQSTFENWQSEFLQLFSFVVLSAVLIHRGSAESRDGTDRIERKVDDLARRLERLDRSLGRSPRVGPSPEDALRLLEADHDGVRSLLERLDTADDDERATRETLFPQLVRNLEAHALVEEEILFPALKEHPMARDVVLEAYEEHRLVDTVLAELSEIPYDDETWAPKLAVMRENLEHHIDEEEAAIFVQARTILDPGELEELGTRMREAKSALLAPGG